MLALPVFAVLMVAFPLGTLLSVQHGRLDSLLQPLVGAEVLQGNRTVVAGALAVVAVQLTLALFVVAAWAERPPPPKETKRE